PSSSPSSSSPSSKPAAPAVPKVAVARDPARAAALRQQIVDALSTRDDHDDEPKRARRDDDAPPAPGNLKDRIGGRGEMLKQLNHDLMPLVDECIQDARERDPALQGLLAVGIETAADDELGGVVELVNFPEPNALQQPELLECVRESALSMTLPPPPESGRDKLMLTIPVEPEATP
ncbi:MAG: hypothetical protein KC468_16600, partial [Myxococcales bacterium]|nr:hypothetical protein [Myxococcales bacterium]